MSDKFELPKEIIAPGDNWVKDEVYEALRDNQYHHYYDIIREFDIKSVLEIGVRARYSMFSMLSANPSLLYRGLEINMGETKRLGFFDHAKKLASGFVEADIKFIEESSRTVDRLPRRFDMIHIDGNHSFDFCFHDLKICAPMSDLLFVDDYDYVEDVKRAVEHFKQVTPEIYSRYIPSYRGNVILFCEKMMSDFK